MSRWIDADDVLELLNLMYDNQEDKDDPYNIGVMGVTNYIKHRAPSIDIVRCSECKYASDNKVYGCMLNHFNDNDYDYHRMYADDFCSRGERKNDE